MKLFQEFTNETCTTSSPIPVCKAQCDFRKSGPGQFSHNVSRSHLEDEVVVVLMLWKHKNSPVSTIAISQHCQNTIGKDLLH